MKSLKIKGKVKSKPRLALVALSLIIVGSVSFSNHPTVGYITIGVGFLLGAYAEFFSGKTKD